MDPLGLAEGHGVSRADLPGSGAQWCCGSCGGLRARSQPLGVKSVPEAPKKGAIREKVAP